MTVLQRDRSISVCHVREILLPRIGEGLVPSEPFPKA